MASRPIKKGSPEAQMFSELIMFRQNYYDPEDTDVFWDEVTDKAKEITEKYKNEKFYDFTRKLFLSHIEDLEKRAKK